MTNWIENEFAGSALARELADRSADGVAWDDDEGYDPNERFYEERERARRARLSPAARAAEDRERARRRRAAGIYDDPAFGVRLAADLIGEPLPLIVCEHVPGAPGSWAWGCRLIVHHADGRREGTDWSEGAAEPIRIGGCPGCRP